MIKKILKRVFLYFILSISIFADPAPVGDLDIKVDIYPYGTTRAYDLTSDGKYILDAGYINSDDGLADRKIAEVHVLMQTKKKGNIVDTNTQNPCVIDGEFNGLLHLKDFANKFEGDGREIPLTALERYNKGENANLKLAAQNFKITHRTIVDEDMKDNTYTFTAYPEQCNLGNKILVFGYKFDLILKATGFKPGDIVRGDINIQDITKVTSGKGTLQAIIEDQMKSIMDSNRRK